MIVIHFVGGPRNGQSKSYTADPRRVGCVTEATAKGMFGIYCTEYVEGRWVAQWKELKPKSTDTK